MALKNAALLAFSALCTSCASCPTSMGEAPRLVTKEPIVVTARVDSFHNLGAFIDFPNAFASYHSVVLVTEGAIGWKSISIQFQGLPTLNGKRLELGQRLRFTLPATIEHGCCAPYLKDIIDAEFLPEREGG